LPLDSVGFNLERGAVVVELEVLNASSTNGYRRLLNFVIDTGAFNTVIDSSFVSELGLRTDRPHPISGLGGDVSGLLTYGLGLRFPGLGLVTPIAVVSTPLGHLSSPTGLRIDGVIANDILNNYCVELSYRDQRMDLYGPDDVGHWDGWVGLDLYLECARWYLGEGPLVGTFDCFTTVCRPRVDASISCDGRSISGKFVIDSGLSAAIMISRHGLASNPWLARRPCSSDVTSGWAGSEDLASYEIDSLTLGSCHFQRPKIQVRNAPVPGDTIGLIGGDALRQMRNVVVATVARKLFVCAGSHP
jgi:hypothetical protein